MKISDYNKATAELKKFNDEVLERRIVQVIIPEILRITEKVSIIILLANLAKQCTDRLFFRNYGYRSPLFWAIKRGEIVDTNRLLPSGQ